MRWTARAKAAYAAWNRPQPSPVTGDMLSPGERVTWHVMGIYRRWTVFILLQAITLLWWTHPRLFPGGLVGWNLAWSDLAIIVEMMVGIAFLNQAMRDARVVRASLAELRDQHECTQKTLVNTGVAVDELKVDTALLRKIYEALHPDGDGQLVAREGWRQDGSLGTILELRDPGALPCDLRVARSPGAMEIRRADSCCRRSRLGYRTTPLEKAPRSTEGDR